MRWLVRPDLLIGVDSNVTTETALIIASFAMDTVIALKMRMKKYVSKILTNLRLPTQVFL